MSTDTSPPRYTIKTVADFCKVPPERRAACLKEFETFLAPMDATTGFGLGEFTWVDDDKNTTTIKLGIGDTEVVLFHGDQDQLREQMQRTAV